MRPLHPLLPLLAGLLMATACNAAARPDWETGVIDYYDWEEQRGYNPERDRILEMGTWNRRELEGHWPESDYAYDEWEDDGYDEEELAPN